MRFVCLAIIIMIFSSVFAQEVYITPPLEFCETPIRTVMDTIFLKAGNIKYSIEVRANTDLGSVTLKLTEKIALDSLLKLILEPAKMEFKKDANGIYHIYSGKQATDKLGKRITKFTDASTIVRDIKKVLERQGRYGSLSTVEPGFEYFGNTGIPGPKAPFLEPPVVFDNEPFPSAVKKLFDKAGGCPYVLDLPEPQVYGTVTAEWKSPVHFHNALSRIFGPKGLAFYVDGGSVYHIVEAEAINTRNRIVSYPRPDPFIFLSESEKAVFKSVNRQNYFEPPFELNGLSAKTALEKIFKKTSIYYGWLDDDKMPENMSKQVNFKIKERMNLEELLKAVLEPLGLRYLECKNGNYCILGKDVKVKIITRTYSFTYATASSLLEQVKNCLSPFGKVEVDESSNSLKITDDEDVFETVENSFKELD